MGLKFNTLDKQKLAEEADMSVILKQRTFRTADGRACADGDKAAAFLIGPKGRKITDETAKSLGLISGRLPETKQENEWSDKERHRDGDKSGRRVPAQGRPIGEPAPPKEGADKSPENTPTPSTGGDTTEAEKRETEIKSIMLDMNKEAAEGGDKLRKKLLTVDGLPDSRIISGRLGEQVSASERDEIWAKCAPDDSPEDGNDDLT